MLLCCYYEVITVSWEYKYEFSNCIKIPFKVNCKHEGY